MKDIQSSLAAARAFNVSGELEGAAPYGSGHINDTYCVSFVDNGARTRFILQKINTSIFKDPAGLMDNISRVTHHLGAKVRGCHDGNRRVLSLIPARSGGPLHADAQGGFWRMYRFVENADSFDRVESPRQAFEAARAFGEFQAMLADLPAPRLHETIPNFHHTPSRVAALERAIASDVCGRASQCKPEIDFALARKSIATVLLDAGLPERVTHNDTKLNNVLLDRATGEGICVIDLDTVMPGLASYDFGDMVRTATSPTSEDETDLSRVSMQFPMFEGLVRGYLERASAFLTAAEREFLAFSGKLITYEIGVRFLTDYLSGDVYFKTHRAGHNLDRCRTQFKLVQSIEEQQDRMERLVASIA